MPNTSRPRCVGRPSRTRSGKTYSATSNSALTAAQPVARFRRQKSAGQKSLATGDVNDDIVLIKRVAENTTASFVPIKIDNNRSAETFTLPTCNWGEAIKAAVRSSDSTEILNALALGIIIKEASVLSPVNLAAFAQLVFNLLGVETSINIFGLDYNSFSSMLIGRLPENGLHALTLDSRKVSMLKITKFIDTITEAVDEVCEQLRTRNDLSKGEMEIEKDLSSDVHQLITSRYVETMMKLADKCNEAVDVHLEVIADRFHLLLYGWDSFLQQGGVLRVRLQLSPGKSHPGIVDITTGWLDQIDAVLSRAQATLSTRTSAFAVSLAQEKNVMSKIWHKMTAQTSSSCDDE
ncbi:unnamed protein product [Angiostrongylus costaricensis]|uniref:WAPL domain-containing protein n=1 Tax=Angiostrongylus costaricensis TaxID=334426 RepID=A0A0R3PFG8_ANGCS|nr:unnamed protein product [Angiostrongylus costaricensis]